MPRRGWNGRIRAKRIAERRARRKGLNRNQILSIIQEVLFRMDTKLAMAMLEMDHYPALRWLEAPPIPTVGERVTALYPFA